MTLPTILIVGPIFVGKTTLFRSLVQRRTIKNHYYPGTKINIYSGELTLAKKKYRLVDSPGIYNLIPTSENEIVTMRLILELKPQLIIFVTREETMEHNLLLMIQLAELGTPFVVALYRKNDFTPKIKNYDYEAICSTFNTKIVSITPILHKGLLSLKKILGQAAPPRWVGAYDQGIEAVLEEFESSFRVLAQKLGVTARFLGLLLMLNNQQVRTWLRTHIAEEDWYELETFTQKTIKNNHSFLIANRWKLLTHSLNQDLLLEENTQQPRYFILLDKYSLTFFWDILLVLGTFLIWNLVMIFVANKLLVNLFYNELFGKYIEPSINHLVTALAGETLLAQAIIGPYGLLTIGFSYAYTVILPSLIVFFFIYSLLDELGYLTRIAVSLNRLLGYFGLNSIILPHLLVASSCKIASAIKTRILETDQEQILTLLILTISIPCLSQFSIIANLLSIIPQQYILIYYIVMVAQLLLVGRLAAFFIRGPKSNFIARITPIKLHSFTAVLQKTWSYILWYLREISPLIIYGTVFLFLLDATGLLTQLKNVLTPLVVNYLELPDKFTETIVLGLVRKDFGAVSIYDLANNGFLNSIQILVAATFLSLTIPCLGYFFALAKERGLRFAVLLLAGSTGYAFIIATLLNKLLRI